ncbi:hypothetical protein M431DRAFT_507827 [Trichoderma harzianum CBS 226.95]|uniref:Uncharacterized protein n=1 Tax=Trichoderma harzianum CBS 226.95 TaxID=983964 RepID=A0A2T4AGI7_TRIHA|nr:hypothetical protein M431DRAFT_507827 [Trichoderma harzianum CBS 226.95]PTB56176.1 hypothetical protein M431DRAFT_507827 [Trichoderma harzianum CBS 226.95]
MALLCCTCTRPRSFASPSRCVPARPRCGPGQPFAGKVYSCCSLTLAVHTPPYPPVGTPLQQLQQLAACDF